MEYNRDLKGAINIAHALMRWDGGAVNSSNQQMKPRRKASLNAGSSRL